VCDKLQKILSLIGLAQKSGRVSSGTMAARTSLVRHRAHLLILSNDISERTGQSLIANCQRTGIQWIVVGDKYQLGACLGKAYRVAATVNDKEMAQSILKRVQSLDEQTSMGVVEWPK
jgi:ribosomal protein L7Ae-like RNA K-turn-binding protein